MTGNGDWQCSNADLFLCDECLGDKVMTDTIWKKLWLLALVANDMEPADADHMFNVLYGNQTIDLNKDPISDALMLIPTKSNGGNCVRTNFTGARPDGLLQQSWAA
jgi:hypothetical protein